MRQVAVVDTETTGFDPATNSLVEIAAVSQSFFWYRSSLIKPKHRISFGAMGAHRITEKMVAHAQEADVVLDWMFRGEDGHVYFDTLAFHNAAFDREFLPEWLREKSYVCTYRCAMHLFPDAESHSNQALRYELDLDLGDMPEEAGSAAHRALYDAWVTTCLLNRLAVEVDGDIQELIDMTQRPLLLKKVKFGKHRDELWADVPRSYLRWILTQDFDADTIHTAKHYLG